MPKMHADELDISVELVHRLLLDQFPNVAGLPIERVPSAGTDNAMFRLGSDWVVRLPRRIGAVESVQKEMEWLPTLSNRLPLLIPTVVAKGHPDVDFPFPWAIYSWLDGDPITNIPIEDLKTVATDLAQFITALQSLDATNGPAPGSHNFNRGEPLGNRDAHTRSCIAQLHGQIDTESVTTIWEAALQTPQWQAAPVWIHGDLQAGNLLVKNGRLHAIIDFGCLGVGDPACELQVAWNLFDAESRQVFRQALQIDDATWARGRGWALSGSVIALPYYQNTNPVLAGIAQQAIDAILAEAGS